MGWRITTRPLRHETQPHPPPGVRGLLVVGGLALGTVSGRWRLQAADLFLSRAAGRDAGGRPVCCAAACGWGVT